MRLKDYCKFTDEELAHLKAAHLTQDEISAIRRHRIRAKIKEEMAALAKEDGQEETKGEKDDAFPYVDETKEFKRLYALMPDIHPAFIGFILTSPYVDPLKGPTKDASEETWKTWYENQKAEDGQGESPLARLNHTLTEAYKAIDFDPKEKGVEIDIYNFDPGYQDFLLSEAEQMQESDSEKDEKLADKFVAVVSAMQFSENFLPVDAKKRNEEMAAQDEEGR